MRPLTPLICKHPDGVRAINTFCTNGTVPPFILVCKSRCGFWTPLECEEIHAPKVIAVKILKGPSPDRVWKDPPRMASHEVEQKRTSD